MIMTISKYILAALICFAFYSCLKLEFIDKPDMNECSLSVNGIEYKTASFGSQCWLAENLREVCITQSNWDVTDVLAPGCICHIQSRLYTWEAAICACENLGEGWKLPSDSDWLKLEEDELNMAFKELIKFNDISRDTTNKHGDEAIGAGTLFNTQETGRFIPNKTPCPTDEIEFSGGCLQNFGCYKNGDRDDLLCTNRIAYYWTSTEDSDRDKAICRKLTSELGINRFPENKKHGLYVRCIKY